MCCWMGGLCLFAPSAGAGVARGVESGRLRRRQCNSWHVVSWHLLVFLLVLCGRVLCGHGVQVQAKGTCISYAGSRLQMAVCAWQCGPQLLVCCAYASAGGAGFA